MGFNFNKTDKLYFVLIFYEQNFLFLKNKDK